MRFCPILSEFFKRMVVFWNGILKINEFLISQTIEMIEKEQREVERRPITKITHKGEIEIESQEPVKAPEPAEVRDMSNITLHYCIFPSKRRWWSACLFPPLVSLSLLPKWQKSQQNLQIPLRRKLRVPRRRKTLPANTNLTCLTYTAKSAQVNPDTSNHLTLVIKLCLFCHVSYYMHTMCHNLLTCVTFFFPNKVVWRPLWRRHQPKWSKLLLQWLGGSPPKQKRQRAQHHLQRTMTCTSLF